MTQSTEIEGSSAATPAKAVKISGLDRSVQNPFSKENLLFSHLNILRQNTLTLNIYLLDPFNYKPKLKRKKRSKRKVRPIILGKRPYIKADEVRRREEDKKHFKENITDFALPYTSSSNKKIIERLKQSKLRKIWANRNDWETFWGIKPVKIKKLSRTEESPKLTPSSEKLKVIENTKITKTSEVSNRRPYHTLEAVLAKSSFSLFKKMLAKKSIRSLKKKMRLKRKERHKRLAQISVRRAFRRKIRKSSLLLGSSVKSVYTQQNINWSLLKALLRTFSLVTYNSKQALFWVVLLKQSLLSIFSLKFGEVNQTLVRVLNTLILKEISFKHLNTKLFRELTKQRFFIYRGASSAILSSIDTFDKNDIQIVSFHGMHFRNVTASLITNYIVTKLGYITL